MATTAAARSCGIRLSARGCSSTQLQRPNAAVQPTARISSGVVLPSRTRRRGVGVSQRSRVVARSGGFDDQIMKPLPAKVCQVAVGK